MWKLINRSDGWTDEKRTGWWIPNPQSPLTSSVDDLKTHQQYQACDFVRKKRFSLYRKHQMPESKKLNGQNKLKRAELSKFQKALQETDTDRYLFLWQKIQSLNTFIEYATFPI